MTCEATFILKRGVTFSVLILQPTGYTFGTKTPRCMARVSVDAPDVMIEFGETAGTSIGLTTYDGTPAIALYVDKANSPSIPIGSYVFDVLLDDADTGETDFLFAGQIEVVDPVTR